MLTLKCEDNKFGIDNFALNEFTVHKKDSSTMMTIHVSINDEFLNSYWADGLIIATPTGSTAYSLSCGGPVLTPGSDNFVITPIAPHNLNLRPLVVRDDVKITIKIDGREEGLRPVFHLFWTCFTCFEGFFDPNLGRFRSSWAGVLFGFLRNGSLRMRKKRKEKLT